MKKTLEESDMGHARNVSSSLKFPRSPSSLMTYQRAHGGSLTWIISISMATHMY